MQSLTAHHLTRLPHILYTQTTFVAWIRTLLPESVQDGLNQHHVAVIVCTVAGLARPAYHQLLGSVVALELLEKTLSFLVAAVPRRVVEHGQCSAFHLEPVGHVAARLCAHHTRRAAPLVGDKAAYVPLLVQPTQQRQVSSERSPVAALRPPDVIL